jgi:hypothetical protein
MSKAERQAALQEKRRCWKSHIEAWKASGLKQSRYCRRHGLKLHQFVYWRKKYAPARTTAPVSLVRVALPGPAFHGPVPPPARPLRLIVGAGRRIEVDRDFDPVALTQLIQTLERL